MTWNLRLSGPAAHDARISGHALRELLDALVDATQRVVRLRVEGRSQAGGPSPAWLEQAARFDVLPFQAGSTVIPLEAPTLAEAAPEHFKQQGLFDDFDPNTSCVDLLSESLADAVGKVEDSQLYDDGALRGFEKFGRLFKYGIERIELRGPRPLEITTREVTGFRELRSQIPDDQRVIVAGKLDALRHSDRVFTLLLEDGANVRGVASNELGIEPFRDLFGTDVRVSGLAKFRPSGSVLRIEAQAVRAAEGDVSVWSRMPLPRGRGQAHRELRKPQGARSGIAAIWGKWSGDESDEEFDAALIQLS